jgi:hypothetical protein
VPDPTVLLQQQIAELQAAAAQNNANVKELAAQLQSTVAALQEAATLAEHRMRRVTIIAALAAACSAASLLIALLAMLCNPQLHLSRKPRQNATRIRYHRCGSSNGLEVAGTPRAFDFPAP